MDRVYPVVMGQLMHAVSVALQRGNAVVIKHGIPLLNRRRNLASSFDAASRIQAVPKLARRILC